MSLEKSGRDQFGSKLGVIAAAAGSAVGLGNIWKFPYEAGQNGGAAFIVVYIISIVVLGLPIMISEFVIGRKARSNALGSFKKLAPNTPWYLTGILGLASSFMILSFYGVVAGWTLEYIYLAIRNGFENQTPADLKETFDAFSTSPSRPLLWQFLFMGLTGWVVAAGVKNGIERITKILMPLLLVIVIVLCGRSLSLGQNIDPVSGEVIGRSFDGLKFLFHPDFSKLNGKVILSALGHAFFSLSLGMGTIITYGSYVGKRNNLTRIAVQVTFLDTLIALLAGIAIFPAVFYFNAKPAEAADLVFTILPSIFEKMVGGYFWTIAFFVLLALAALTSSISLLEVAVAYFSDQLNMNRVKVTIYTTILISFLGVACSLSLGPWDGFTVLGYNFFGIMEYAS